MMWRALCIGMSLGLLAAVGGSAHAVPFAVQATGTEPATAAVDPVDPNGNAVNHPHRKQMRRCARRSRLGICERWNMPKSALPVAKPDQRPDARNTPAKH